MTTPRFHRNDLPGYARREMPKLADVVYTPPLRQLLTEVSFALDRNGMVAVDGPFGSGKTTAQGVVEKTFADHVDQCVRLEIGDDFRSKATFAELYYAITGQEHGGTQRQIIHALHGLLAERSMLIKIDEAQDVPAAAIKPLRKLWGAGSARCTILLSGKGLRRILSTTGWGEIGSRVEEIVSFDPIGDADLLPALAQFHPILAETDPWILRRLNRVHAEGNWREWAHIANKAADQQGPDTDPRGITEGDAKQILFRLTTNPTPEGWDDEDDRWESDYPSQDVA